MSLKGKYKRNLYLEDAYFTLCLLIWPVHKFIFFGTCQGKKAKLNPLYCVLYLNDCIALSHIVITFFTKKGGGRGGGVGVVVFRGGLK